MGRQDASGDGVGLSAQGKPKAAGRTSGEHESRPSKLQPENKVPRLLALLTILLCAALSKAEDLQISAIPLFLGFPASQHFPLLVKVQNIGPSTRGAVFVEGSDLTTRYPIELPTGSSKAFIAYVNNLETYEPLKITLDTNAGSAQEKITIPYGASKRVVITISSNAGGLGYLRDQTFTKREQQNYSENSSTTVADTYANPDRLPDRSAAYDGVWAILLGQGAERMSDVAVSAIHNYVLTGGIVAFVGGASPQVLKDPRWADLAPVSNIHTETKGSLALTVRNPYANGILTTQDLLLNGPVTIAVGELSKGAKAISMAGTTPLIATKPFGAGTAMFFAADPFEEPITKFDSRKNLMATVLQLDLKAPRSAFLKTMAHPGDVVSSSQGYYRRSPPTPSDNNPFNVTLPTSFNVFGILLAYALLVAPINLFILRKMKRGEWAWLTAPVISLGFAALFFNFASGLYSSVLSKQTSGVLVADASSNSAYFLGSTQMFFPRGGSYDLRLANAEYVTSVMPNSYNGYGSSYPVYHSAAQTEQWKRMSAGINPVDVGEVLVPALSAGNLSFFQLNYGQRMALTPPVTARLTPKGDHIAGTLTNNTRFILSNPSVEFDGRYVRLPLISPGETLKVDYEGSKNLEESLLQLSLGRVLFTATIKDFSPGVQIGAQASGGTITLLENIK